MPWGTFGPILWGRLVDFPSIYFQDFMWYFRSLLSKWWRHVKGKLKHSYHVLAWTIWLVPSFSFGMYSLLFECGFTSKIVAHYSMYWTVGVSHTMLCGCCEMVMDLGSWWVNKIARMLQTSLFCIHKQIKQFLVWVMLGQFPAGTLGGVT